MTTNSNYNYYTYNREQKLIVYRSSLDNSKFMAIYLRCDTCGENAVVDMEFTDQYECRPVLFNHDKCVHCKNIIGVFTSTYVKFDFCEHCNGSGVGLNQATLEDVPHGCTRCSGIGRLSDVTSVKFA